MTNLSQPFVLEAAAKVVLAIFGIMTAAAYLVLLERWMAAWVQDRKGPNRVGIPLTKIKMFGLGQPLADGLKMILKEEYVPAHVDKVLYVLAPISILITALAVFAVIPFGSVLPAVSGPTAGGVELSSAGPIELLVAPGVNVGLVYIFALSSMAVYGVILGGWSSNNKYSFLGALRSSAQLISYELPLSLGILSVVLASSSMQLERIISMQAASGMWNIIAQPLGCLVFLVASFAEAGRLPFDLPECEQELIGGYHTEYAGMKLLLYLIAEFLHMVTAAFLLVVLFLGGWHLWGVTGSDETVTWATGLIRMAVLLGKVLLVILFMMLVRWSWPRFRFDQLMALAWKGMLPLGLVNLLMMAIIGEYGDAIRERWGDVGLLALSWGVALASVMIAAVVSPLASDNRPRLGGDNRPRLGGGPVD